MKIAVSATGPDLEANVDPRFGRCPYILIVDVEDMKVEALENANTSAARAAGISTGQVVADKGVEAIITGNIGPNAYRVLSAAPIKIYSGVTGTVKDAIEKLKKDELKETLAPNVQSHFGTGPGMGTGGRQ